MEIDWQPTISEMITHEAYDPTSETIYLRFKDGAEWGYGSCPPHVWDEFTQPNQSRGQYFHAHLKYKPAAKVI